MSGNCKACENLGCAMRGTDWTPNPAMKCFGWMPQTNYDLLISKTPEELAEWLDDNDSNFPISDGGGHWLSWLKSPVEEGE